MVPGGHKPGRARNPGRRRWSPDQQGFDAFELVPARDAGNERTALVGPAVQGHDLAADLLSELAARDGQLGHVLAAVSVAEKDRNEAAGILEPLVRGQVAYLGRRLGRFVVNMHRPGM